MNLEPLKESEVRKGKPSIICKCINMESRKMVLMNLVENWVVDTLGKGGGGTNWESSIDIYSLSCVRQTVSGKLLNNTGSQPGALWWPPGAEWGKEKEKSKGRNLYMQLWLNWIVVQQKLIKNCKANFYQLKKILKRYSRRDAFLILFLNTKVIIFIMDYLASTLNI